MHSRYLMRSEMLFYSFPNASFIILLTYVAPASTKSDTTSSKKSSSSGRTNKCIISIEHHLEKKADPCTSRSNPKARNYEYHDLGAGSDTWIALAVPGCGSCDLGCLLKHNIVAAACGIDHMQTGQHGLDRTPQPPLGTMAGNDVYTEYRAFNISYFDNGIFGILAKTRACSAAQVARNAAEFLANVSGLNFQQIATGKKRLKVCLAINDGDCVKVAEGLALQIANGHQFDNARSSSALVDLIPPDEVVATARALSSKSTYMSMAVVGDVGAVPPGSELL